MLLAKQCFWCPRFRCSILGADLGSLTLLLFLLLSLFPGHPERSEGPPFRSNIPRSSVGSSAGTAAPLISTCCCQINFPQFATVRHCVAQPCELYPIHSIALAIYPFISLRCTTASRNPFSTRNSLLWNPSGSFCRIV